ncbi:MAG: hypothetical protein IPK71_14605 [Myxococcales bacterium]|jgi:hypothetical protein|nr:hypothetical protein [Myxococcales bacterium]MBL9111459.1 hypothetical protein [Myxococcales bacterium]
MKLARFYGVGAVLFAVSTAVLSGCAGQEGPKHAQIKAGEMPEGESFTGVYFHPVYGYLHMVEDGSNIFGKWKRADQSRWGELQGTKTGNLVRFTWKEHTIGLVGAGAESKGKGYFLYKTGKDVAELDGQFGLGDDETGADWHNVKQQRMAPDLKSIPGDTDATSTPTGETWN